jgi:hypothetical protein
VSKIARLAPPTGRDDIPPAYLATLRNRFTISIKLAHDPEKHALGLDPRVEAEKIMLEQKDKIVMQLHHDLMNMTDEDERELGAELARLQQEHRDLDAAIDALHQSPAPDLLRLQRLKKRKLQLRDRIAFIEDQITPDIIA